MILLRGPPKRLLVAFFVVESILAFYGYKWIYAFINLLIIWSTYLNNFHNYISIDGKNLSVLTMEPLKFRPAMNSGIYLK